MTEKYINKLGNLVEITQSKLNWFWYKKNKKITFFHNYSFEDKLKKQLENINFNKDIFIWPYGLTNEEQKVKCKRLFVKSIEDLYDYIQGYIEYHNNRKKIEILFS